jgi:hypothetical protein
MKHTGPVIIVFCNLYGRDKPDNELKKLYDKNALKLVPGLPADEFPS